MKTARVNYDAKEELLVDHQVDPEVLDALSKCQAKRVAVTEGFTLELLPGAIPVKNEPGNLHRLYRSNLELQAKLGASTIQVNRQVNSAGATEDVNLKLVPGAVSVKSAPGNKHGLHRTKQDLQAKLGALQGTQQHANSVVATKEVNLKIEPGAVPFKRASGNGNGLKRTKQELQAKLGAMPGYCRMNGGAATNQVNLNSMPVAIPVKRAPGKKHGLHRTNQEFRAKLDALRGTYTSIISRSDAPSHTASTEVKELPVHGCWQCGCY
jgi:hypothetical protein